MKIRYLKKAKIALADNEKASRWEHSLPSEGTISLRDNSLQLTGTWRVSWIGNFLGSGILGAILIRPFFQSSRTENIALDHIERVVFANDICHLFQSREGGMSEVHVFSSADASKKSALKELITGAVPNDRIRT